MHACEQPSFFLDADVVWVEDDLHATAPSGDSVLSTSGEVAAEFAVSPRTLRFYESKGLMSPLRQQRTRLYSKKDRQRLALILKAKKFGFVLAEIQNMIEAQEGRARGQSLKLSRQKCGEQIDLLEQQLRDVNEALAELRRIHTILSGSLDGLGGPEG